MEEGKGVNVRMLGLLHSFRKERGEPVETSVQVPSGGRTAAEIAEGLELPLELIEGVFLDHKIHALEVKVMPGERIAFVSRGVPGPHRFTLGLYHAGRESVEQ